MAELIERLESFGTLYRSYTRALNTYNNLCKRQAALSKMTPREYCEQSKDEPFCTFTNSEKTAKKSIDEAQTKIEELEKDYRYKPDSLKNAAEKKKTAKKNSSQAEVLGALIVCGLIPLAFLIFGAFTFSREGITTAVLLGLLIGVICFAFWGIRIQSRTDSFNASIDYELNQDLSELSSKHNNSIANLTQQKDAAQNDLKQLDTQRPAILKASQETLKTELSKLEMEINRSRKKCVELLAQLKKNPPIPAEDDWPRVDRIIKLIKTGRANTLSEALNLCDQEDRHNKQLAAENKRRQEQRQFQEEMRSRREAFERDIMESQQREQALHAAELLQQKQQHEKQMAAATAQLAAGAIETATLKKEVSDLKKEIKQQGQQTL